MTAAQLRREIARWQARRAKALDELSVADKVVQLLEAQLSALQNSNVSTTVASGDMDTRTISPESNAHKKEAISRTKTKHASHKFVAACQADPRYGSPAAWARAHGAKPSTVASWYSTGSSKRPIPSHWAAKVADDFRDPRTKRTPVPADASSWPNGII